MREIYKVYETEDNNVFDMLTNTTELPQLISDPIIPSSEFGNIQVSSFTATIKVRK